jgi:hypothetical protein
MAVCIGAGFAAAMVPDPICPLEEFDMPAWAELASGALVVVIVLIEFCPE